MQHISLFVINLNIHHGPFISILIHFVELLYKKCTMYIYIKLYLQIFNYKYKVGAKYTSKQVNIKYAGFFLRLWTCTPLCFSFYRKSIMLISCGIYLYTQIRLATLDVFVCFFDTFTLCWFSLQWHHMYTLHSTFSDPLMSRKNLKITLSIHNVLHINFNLNKFASCLIITNV